MSLTQGVCAGWAHQLQRTLNDTYSSTLDKVGTAEQLGDFLTKIVDPNTFWRLTAACGVGPRLAQNCAVAYLAFVYDKNWSNDHDDNTFRSQANYEQRPPKSEDDAMRSKAESHSDSSSSKKRERKKKRRAENRKRSRRSRSPHESGSRRRSRTPETRERSRRDREESPDGSRHESRRKSKRGRRESPDSVDDSSGESDKR